MLTETIMSMPAVDTHTHIDALHPTARGLDDILLYHMVISELYAAGCPDGSRLPEHPSDEYRLERLERAIPFIPWIRNTSCYWGVRMILAELYGITEEITLQNFRAIDNKIKSAPKGIEAARAIMRKAGICCSNTELWHGQHGVGDEIFEYSLEWAFFTRSQWGQFDTALLELEHAWNSDPLAGPLPVTCDRDQLHFSRIIHTVEDCDAAIDEYCRRLPLNQVVNVVSHFSTYIHYRQVERDEFVKALANRGQAGEYERDVYANYVFNSFLEKISALNCRVMLGFSLAAEPLPFETGSRIDSRLLFELAQIFHRYPRIRFVLFVANEAANQGACTLVRELPNVYLSGYWWHNFFPNSIRKVLEQRLDMLPVNRTAGFFSDAYCMDWCYAKSMIVRKEMCRVFAEKVASGQYSEETALEICRQIMTETAFNELGFRRRSVL